MSADNTIIVLESKNKDGILEYRVAHMLNAEEMDDPVYGSWRRWNDFKNSHLYLDKKMALISAHALEEEIGYVEYGVCIIQDDHPFPTPAEIREDLLKKYNKNMMKVLNIPPEHFQKFINAPHNPFSSIKRSLIHYLDQISDEHILLIELKFLYGDLAVGVISMGVLADGKYYNTIIYGNTYQEIK